MTTDRALNDQRGDHPPPSPDLYIDDNDSKEDDSLHDRTHWIQDERLLVIERQVKSGATTLLETAYGYITSTEWGRRAHEYILVKPRQAPKRIGIFVGAAVFMLLLLLYMLKPAPRHHPHKFTLTGGGSHFSKPEGVKIYGLVFYGRRGIAEILDCYLQRNLARNGDWLDAVHFIINTDDQDDLA